MLSLCALTACATQPDKPATQPAIAAVANPYPSTYRAPQSPPVLIRSATVLIGTGTRLDGADDLVAEGRISAIGAGLAAPAGAQVIDASGRPMSSRQTELRDRYLERLRRGAAR